MSQQYSNEQIYEAMRRADAAGDAEAVKALAAALKAGASKQELNRMAAEKGLELNQADLDANIASREAGGATGEVMTPQRALIDATVATGKGLAKAVAGPYDLLNEASGGVQNALTYAITDLPAYALDALGAEGAANWLRDAGSQRRADINQATNALSFRNALDQTVPTAEGLGNVEFASELAAGLMLPIGPRANPRIQAPQAAANQAVTQSGRMRPDTAGIVQEGARRNVPVFTTDVRPPNSGMGRYVKQTLPEKIPLAGMSGPRQAQQEARQAAVASLVEEFGGDTGRALFESLETIPQQVSKMLTDQRGARLTALTNAKDSVIDGIEAPLAGAPNTLRAISEQVRDLRRIDEKAFEPVIERLQRFGERLQSGGLSLRDVEENRKLLGELFSEGNLAQIKGRGQKAINAIYDPLRRDMGAFIEAQAGAGARNRWARANEELAALAGELKSATFRNVLKDADMTPENVSRILFSNPDNTSDITRLVSNLDKAGRRKVQAALMTRAWEKAGGTDGVSVERFLDNLKQLSGKIGVAFEGADREALEGTRRLLEATRRAAESGANIRTGEQNLPTILGVGATQALGLTGGVATLGVGGLMARVYESSPVRNLLIRLNKTKAGSVQESKVLDLIMKESAPIVNNWRDEVARAVNDNPAGSLAAQEQQIQEPQ